MRAPPRCSMPVGLGAKRTRTVPSSISLTSPQETDSLGGYSFAPTRKAEVLSGGTAHAYARSLDTQSTRQVLTHSNAVVSYLWTFADDNRVHVRYLPGLADERIDLAQKFYGVCVPVALVSVGEVVADIFEGGSAEEGVGDGVGEDVGIGVAKESLLEGYLYPAEDEPTRPAVFREGVDVDT